MEVHFEDTTTGINEATNARRSTLSFHDYHVDDRFKTKVPDSLKGNVRASICELAKLFEPLGYLFEFTDSNR